MRALQASLASLLLLAAANAAELENPSPSRSSRTHVERAIERALAWVSRHPASGQDGGLQDMIDEGLSFFVLHNISRDKEDRDRFGEMMGERMAAVARHPDFERWVGQPGKTLIDHYHLVLAAHLIRVAGKPSNLQPAIVSQAQRALSRAPGQQPTVRLTVARLLQYLGESPNPPVDALLAASVIEQIERGRLDIALPAPASAPPPVLSMTRFLLYALVHEVAALVDFGRFPPSPWVETRRDTIIRTLMGGIRWARDLRDFDLLSELMVTTHLLGAPANEEVLTARDLLLATQQPDGSWGASLTTRRRNRVRHAVLTSSAALWAYGKDGQGQ